MGRRAAAFAARADRPCLHPRTKLHGGNEAVADGAVITLGARISFGAERSERAPLRRGECNRDAGLRVTEGLRDRPVVALEAVDLPPRHCVATEVLHEPLGGFAQRRQSLRIGRLLGHVIPHRNVLVVGRLFRRDHNASPQNTASDVGAESNPQR